MTLQEAYEILKTNAQSDDCNPFVYLSQIEELLEIKPKYNQELVEKVRNREIVIEVDGFEGIKDLINYIYPDDTYLDDEYVSQRNYYFTGKNIWYNQRASQYYEKTLWASEFVNNNEDMENKPRVKAIEFLAK